MKAIIMNAEMAKAILDRGKVQTRRAIKREFRYTPNQEYKYSIRNKKGLWDYFRTVDEFISNYSSLQKGDTVWVREPAIVTNYISRFYYTKIDYRLKSDDKNEYRIDVPVRFFPNPKKWLKECQSVPNGCIKEMARTFLKIIDVRVERLHDMTVEDSIKEGLTFGNTEDLIREEMINLKTKLASDNLTTIEKAQRNSFIELWDKTAPKGYKWGDNPPVFVYDFEVLSENPNTKN